MSSSTANGYKELASCQVAGVRVSKYKSNKTGLVVCLAEVEGPLVNGYICLGKPRPVKKRAGL